MHAVAPVLASLDYVEHGSVEVIDTVPRINVGVTRAGRLLRGWSPQFESSVALAALSSRLVHNHGLWMMTGIYARRAAGLAGVSIVISPRGMLEPWALRRAAARKKMAALLYENRNLRSARVFHATSEDEASAIRAYGLTQPIAIIPNGVDVPERPSAVNRSLLEKRWPALRGRRWMLFLGRLHAKKGLDVLIDAWRRLAPRFETWHLLIAGPDLDGYGAGIRQRVDRDPLLREQVTFTDMLQGDEKHIAMAEAELFVLPTLSENFGLAIAEALAHGTPVLTTTAAPWREIRSHECGWWIDPGERSLHDALNHALSVHPDALADMGHNGRALVTQRYSWDVVGAEMAKVYRWIVVGSERPTSIYD